MRPLNESVQFEHQSPLFEKKMIINCHLQIFINNAN